MKLLRRLFFGLLILVCLGLAAAAAEAAWYSYVFGLARPSPRASMLAVFGGGSGRTEAGWTLEKRGDFKYLVFSDQSAELVRQWERRMGPPRRARLLLEPLARTTAQNARFVSRLAREHRCRTVMVLTSWWHLPRALFLTHLALLNSGVDILGWPVEDGAGPSQAWDDPRVWLEWGRFWGSLLTFESDSRRRTTEFGGIFSY